MSGAAESETQSVNPTIEPKSVVVRTRFRLERKLGTGGMGTVWLCRDTTLQRWVALKSIRPDLCGNEAFRKRMERECLLHAKVGAHANIVTLYDIIEDSNEIHLVMEYVEGQTLHQRLQECVANGVPMPWSEAVSIVSQSLAALGRIHEHGIVHRDIKPANIMLIRESDGSVCAKLTDFGIARSEANNQKLTQLTSSGSVSPGTPLYMSPEQIDARTYGEVTERSDIYAMGIVFYQCLSGHVPFEGTLTQVLNGHLNSTPPPLVLPTGDQIPPELVSAANKAMVKRQDDRYQSARAFRADLERVISGGQITEVPTIVGQVPIEAAASGRKNKKLVWLAVSGGIGLCLVAVVGMAVAMLGGQPSSSNPPEARRSAEPTQTVGQQRTWPGADSVQPDVVSDEPEVAVIDTEPADVPAVLFGADSEALPAEAAMPTYPELNVGEVQVVEPGEPAESTADETVATAEDGPTHVVELGDSLSKIAKAYDLDVITLAKWNLIEDASQLRVGTTLYLYERPGLPEITVRMGTPKPKAEPVEAPAPVVAESTPPPAEPAPAAPVKTEEKKGFFQRIKDAVKEKNTNEPHPDTDQKKAGRPN